MPLLPTAFDADTLSRCCGRPVQLYQTCASTNRLAKEAARGWPGPPVPGPLLVADHQTGGRGRQGRTWESPAGQNLLFSLVLRPPVPPTEAARCVLQWAAAMAEVLDLRVKWPNDLVTEEGRKVGGILAELETRGERPLIRWIVLGVGINVNQDAFPAELAHATSLRIERGRVFDRAAQLARLVKAIEAVDVEVDEPLRQWRERSHTLGRRVRVGEIEGIATGIREDGALLINEHPVLTGDVELVA